MNSSWRRVAAQIGLTALSVASFGPWANAQTAAEPATPDQRPDVQAFIAEMATKHGFATDELTALFARTRFRDDVIAAITKPAEAKPWYEYRKIFVTEDRIQNGVNFMKTHAKALAQAEARYGVPREIVTAIIGVETRYGSYTGRFRVMDALTTLGFNYPPRALFFRGELEQTLLLAREEQADPLSLLGSYAGAMGQPQFIPSSFRNYAVDFDGDGKRNLWSDVDDVIGSVAHYFAAHGWQKDKPIGRKAQVTGTGYQTLLAAGTKPSYKVKDMRKVGVIVKDKTVSDLDAALIELEGDKGKEYRVTFNNFYVITRYNRSALYAMAVYQVSEAIKTRAEAASKPHAKTSSKADGKK